ncbi:pancreatic lipase-related protein 2-like [Aricia agestis]|uniref:pancreatic lipase-related protein 2-like n=1 Tax=Aricia agestis TaxID=91739 RepID=UPI001C2076B1|nr:pancreatic lipase-related protein 2-like [Aricia agestis]
MRYGEEWLYFYDDNGTQHVMNFSSEPVDSRDMFYGEIYFDLYTRHNPLEPEALSIPEPDKLMESKYFNSSLGVKMVTHGWVTSAKAQWMQNIKNALLHYHDLNVITVDWYELSRNSFYPWPAYSTRYVGREIATFIAALVRSYNITGSSFHLIGHSLGAQVMGYAGMFSNETIQRITGLDPARPLFEVPEMPVDYCLDRTDAYFVDIIHTCGGVYGYRKSYGHADFYPNSGMPAQPGCSDISAIMESCSHGRAPEFFEESISHEPGTGFLAYPCENWDKFDKGECKENATNMGYPATEDSRGDYFLHTSDTPKYAEIDKKYKY